MGNVWLWIILFNSNAGELNYQRAGFPIENLETFYESNCYKHVKTPWYMLSDFTLKPCIKFKLKSGEILSADVENGNFNQVKSIIKQIYNLNDNIEGKNE